MESTVDEKADNGFKSLAESVGDKEFIVDGKFCLADVSVGSVCGYVNVGFSENLWGMKYPELARYVEELGERLPFWDTVPVGQKIKH
jgi:glutathione S-transferase